MRFSAPRSISPSPTRATKRRTLKQRRRSSTFGLQSDSDDSDYDSDRSYASELSDSPSVGALVLPPLDHSSRNSLSSSERRYVDETISAIRLRIRHHDSYEEWEKDTRRDAFLSARKEQTQIQRQLTEEQERLRLRQAQHIAELHARQADEVARKLRDLQLHQQSEERRLKEVWDSRAKQQWQRIEGVIKQEEDKLKAKLEAERKVREEEEKRRREADLKQRLLEEKKRQEEEAKKQEEEESKRKQEEERKQREEEEQRLLKEQQEKDERTKAERDQRQALGVTTALEDWRQARQALHVSSSQHPQWRLFTPLNV
ncbi:GLE1 protein-domain-containing protein [Salix suchowensis]|nr:GLE1 protein-domain-containing protein [Salix suchowensis]